MKKYFICAFLFGSFITANKATAQQGFSFSLKTTPLYSFLRNKTDFSNANYSRKPTLNTNFGIGGTYNFTKNMGIGADVLYACQGQRYTINGTPNDYYQKNKYIKVPLYLSYDSDVSKRISFIGKIGPQISFLSQSALDYENESKLSSNTKEKYKTTTFGAMALAGTQYKLSDNLYFTSGIRFDYDYSNAEDYHYTAAINNRAKSHNMTTGVELGFKYVFRK
jgi:opacity protein-like surface antigen